MVQRIILCKIYSIRKSVAERRTPKGTNKQEVHRSAMDIRQCNPNGWFPVAGKSCIIDGITMEKPK